MPKIHFTDLTVQALKPGTYYDTKLPGFGLRVLKNRKTWIVVKGRSRTKERIGHYPDVALSDARKRAMKALASPLERKPAPSFPEALETYLGQKKWRPRTLLVMKSSLRHFAWKKAIDKITHENVVTALDAIEAPSARAHALKDVRAFFNWTIPRYLDHSPCRGIKMAKQSSRSRVLSDEELKAIWNAAEGQYGAIVKLLILSGQRRGEVASCKLTWLRGNAMTLPATVVKNKLEHTFPLSGSALELLPLAVGNQKFTDWERKKRALDKASGVLGWTLHDLRRTFATGLAQLGVPIHVTEKILNHVSGSLSGVAGIYNRHSYWEEQVAAIQAWENRVKMVVDINQALCELNHQTQV